MQRVIRITNDTNLATSRRGLPASLDGAGALLSGKPVGPQMPGEGRRVQAVAERVGLPRDLIVPEARSHEDGLGVRKLVARELALLVFLFREHGCPVELGSKRAVIGLRGGAR